MADIYKVVSHGPDDHSVVIISTGSCVGVFDTKKEAQAFCAKANKDVQARLRKARER